MDCQAVPAVSAKIAEAYVEQVQINVDLIRCSLNYVQGSNIKLISGKWDAQFVAADPGTKIQRKNFKLEAIGQEAVHYFAGRPPTERCVRSGTRLLPSLCRYRLTAVRIKEPEASRP